MVNGFTAPRFAPLREALAASFARHGEVGAACAVMYRGELVADLWGGWADREAGRVWQADTIGLVFSATKGVTAACLHALAERGAIDLDAPIAAYWPEFAAAGKGAIPVRWAMCHRAGVPAVDAELTLEQVLAWDPVVRAVAAQAPEWPPGSAHGYHARTYGWILGEVVRRVTGRTLGNWFAEHFAAPLGLDFWIGLPEELEARVARLYPAPPLADEQMRALLATLMAPDTLMGRVFNGPNGLFDYGEMWNRRALHAAEMPSSNGIGSARALARFYAALIGEVDGVRLLRPDTLAAACVVQSEGDDRVLRLPTRFGSGFMLPPMIGPDAGPRAFGHPGAGGSLALADPDQDLAFAYVMNQMGNAVTADPRASTLLRVAYECL
ncbi:MAG: serine hydrolase domain-containing protein [Deltaproteobacteria bacterium]|nr:serine hydrolase domain-containing protein [Deltaproteobacteria bacterium]